MDKSASSSSAVGRVMNRLRGVSEHPELMDAVASDLVRDALGRARSDRQASPEDDLQAWGNKWSKSPPLPPWGPRKPRRV
jgi:hypothetical protein